MCTWFTGALVRKPVPADGYRGYDDLALALREGVDYAVHVRYPANSAVAVIAPHGGRIEGGTSAVARLIAGADHGLYLFEGLRTANDNFDHLHLTSHCFDEPRCLERSGRAAPAAQVWWWPAVRKKAIRLSPPHMHAASEPRCAGGAMSVSKLRSRRRWQRRGCRSRRTGMISQGLIRAISVIGAERGKACRWSSAPVCAARTTGWASCRRCVACWGIRFSLTAAVQLPPAKAGMTPGNRYCCKITIATSANVSTTL